MLKLLENIYKLFDSSIDFAQPDLDKSIWDKSTDTYTLKNSVKTIILNKLKEYKKIDLIEIAKAIHITGSIGTTQYLDDTDIDTHIVVDSTMIEDAENVQKDVFKYFRDNITYINKHPIEVFLQYNAKQELLAEAAYNILTDEWLRGPKIVSSDYDPYNDFSDVLDDVENLARDADIKLGEIKRDTIDYATIVDALRMLPDEFKQKLLVNLKAKLNEIQTDIQSLMKMKREWIQVRRNSSLPDSEKQALEDVENVKTWRVGNATFKFLNRYKYFKTITKLEQLLADGELDTEEVSIINKIMTE